MNSDYYVTVVYEDGTTEDMTRNPDAKHPARVEWRRQSTAVQHGYKALKLNHRDLLGTRGKNIAAVFVCEDFPGHARMARIKEDGGLGFALHSQTTATVDSETGLVTFTTITKSEKRGY